MEKYNIETYQVIEIVNPTTLIINYGLSSGAKVGDKLRISGIGQEVKDLNGNSLGTLDVIKDTVTVEIPYELFSICRKINFIEIPSMSPLSELLQATKEIKKLKVDPADMTNRSLPHDSPIKVGDKVIKIN